MKRVRQHVIEEESRKEFANILPNEWVCNDFHKDYGKDIHVEIFKDNVATGKTFIVQLKGTDQEPLHGIVAIAIKIDTLRYYATIQNAVLLVFYNTRQKSFKAIWANHLIHTINITPKQKVTYVKLNGQHSVDKPYFKKLENSFSPQHPSKQNLCFTSDTPIGKLFSKRIMKWIEKYYPNSYEIADFTLPFRYETKFIETQNAIVPTVQINEDPILELDPIIKKDLLPFLISPLIDINAINNEEAELLFLVSSRFVQFNPEASYLFLKQLIIKYTGRYKNQNTLAQIAQFAIENRLINDLQTLIEITAVR